MSQPTLQQTRQQLDDLDGLIQRMLTLPLSHLDERPNDGVAMAQRIPPEEFAPLPFPGRLHRAKPQPVPAVEEPVRGWRIEFGEGNRSANRSNSIPLPGEPFAEPILEYATIVEDNFTRPYLPTLAPAVLAVEPVPAPLWPLYATTRVFDAVFGWMPLVGAFTRPTGKALLGLAGLTMIAGAVVWAYLDRTEFRWTAPQQTPNIGKPK